MANSRARVARFEVDKVSGIRVSVPRGLNDNEFALILKKIRDFTGCAGCAASGNNPLVFDQRFRTILEVPLSKEIVTKSKGK